MDSCAERHTFQLEDSWSIPLFLAGFMISTFNFCLMVCACGNLDLLALPGSLAGAAMVWVAFCAGRQPLLLRLVADAALVVTTLILLKNVGDVLWFGHGPLL